MTTAAAPAPTTAPAPADPASPPIVVVPDAGSEFDTAFAELTAPTPAPTPAPTAAPVADPPAPTAAPVADPPVGAPAPTPAPAPAASADVTALQAQLAELTAKLAQAPAAPAPTAAPVAEKPIYSAEETAALEHHKKEWSEVAAGEALVRRDEYRQLIKYIFDQISPRLDELSQSAQTVGTRSQYNAIKELVPDYDSVREPTIAWVDKQPAYLKSAFQEIAAKGTPDEIADMITRFKKETGWTAAAAPALAAAPAAAAPVPAPAPTAAPVAALSPQAQAAIASLRPVSGGRTEIPHPADPNDYDGAFKEFANMK